jgi:uncharacterized protein YoxC
VCGVVEHDPFDSSGQVRKLALVADDSNHIGNSVQGMNQANRKTADSVVVINPNVSGIKVD